MAQAAYHLNPPHSTDVAQYVRHFFLVSLPRTSSSSAATLIGHLGQCLWASWNEKSTHEFVNDALKRVKLSQSKNPARAAGPAIRLRDSKPRSHHQDMLFGLLAGVILLLGGFLVWQWSHAGDNELHVRARTLPAAYASPEINRRTSVAAHPANSSRIVILVPDQATGVTDAVAFQTAAPEPAFKLKSVLYLPANPSAIVNGKLVHINSILNGARVVAIKPGAVTLVTADGQTNVLVMPDDARP
jgi:hypothetical protein